MISEIFIPYYWHNISVKSIKIEEISKDGSQKAIKQE